MAKIIPLILKKIIKLISCKYYSSMSFDIGHPLFCEKKNHFDCFTLFGIKQKMYFLKIVRSAALQDSF